MKKVALILATVAAIGVTAVSAPTQAEARGRFGPGLAFGLAAGAIAAGAYGAYGPGYGYYGPRYYRQPVYGYGYGPGYGYGGPRYYGRGYY